MERRSVQGAVTAQPSYLHAAQPPSRRCVYRCHLYLRLVRRRFCLSGDQTTS
ncbi:Uncharacterised protein [Vibrio cholerae]|nr:Uncharacterised protein [Vibrio cholerae]